jgi:dipeptidyl aminopeptidase/acylaminoacyl peptidase
VTAEPEELAPDEQPAPLNPLSIEAMRRKGYDGRDLTLGRVLAKAGSYTRYAATYKSGDLTISGIMNIPEGKGPFPVIVTNHGYIDPEVYTSGRGLRREQDYLGSRGFTVLHPDYRCHADSDCPQDSTLANRLGYTEDVINAVKAIQSSEIAVLDQTRIGMLGHSMGGGIAWAVSVILPDVKALIMFAPVSPNVADSYYRWLQRRPEVAEEVREAHGEPDKNPEFWESISPQTYFDFVVSPIQIHHGTADESVPTEWSQAAAEKLKGLGKSVELFTYDGQPHEFTSAWGLVMQRSIDFFRANLD